MTATNANVNASQEWLPLSHADSLALADGYYTIDTENVKVEKGPHPAASTSRTTYNGRRAQRGVGGSTAASHSSGATLTRYYPDAASGGGGGVTVDNTVDAPFSASTLVAAGATESAPGEATLASVATVLSVTVPLTDAQIKALPTTPIVIVAPTEDLQYAGAPTSMPVPLRAVLAINQPTEAVYTNRDGVLKIVLGGANDGFKFAEDDTNALGVSAVSILQMFRDPDVAASTWYFNLTDNVLDNGLRLAAANTGDFTGGDAANSGSITVLYTIVDL